MINAIIWIVKVLFVAGVFYFAASLAGSYIVKFKVELDAKLEEEKQKSLSGLVSFLSVLSENSKKKDE